MTLIPAARAQGAHFAAARVRRIRCCRGLDGDGRREILYPSYDGRLHATWLDKTERGSWPFDVPGPGIRFASEPVVAELRRRGIPFIVKGLNRLFESPEIRAVVGIFRSAEARGPTRSVRHRRYIAHNGWRSPARVPPGDAGSVGPDRQMRAAAP